MQLPMTSGSYAPLLVIRSFFDCDAIVNRLRIEGNLKELVPMTKSLHGLLSIRSRRSDAAFQSYNPRLENRVACMVLDVRRTSRAQG